MIKEAIASVVDKKDLTKDEASKVMEIIMSGRATPSQIAGLLVAMRNKGETPEEIAGFALAMREAAIPLGVKSKELVDNCGTGGDGKQGLNISTAAAFVVAGAGFTVAKHGNRSISSKCGSADVLEAMGVKVDCLAAGVESCVNGAGIGFMFAPNFHPAMKYAMPTRKELGIRTVFNLLGPLTNPAKAQVQLIGVFDPKLTGVIANVLKQMGQKAGAVVHSNGWDEVTLDGKTNVSELVDDQIRDYELTADDFGLPKVSSSDLSGGDAPKNGEVILKILEGEKIPARHVVVANAALLIQLATKAYKNKSVDLKEAVRMAEESIDSGKANQAFKLMADSPTTSIKFMSDVLENILAFRRKDVEASKEKVPLTELEAKAETIPLNGFVSALIKDTEISIIAEMKRQSPSAGVIREQYDPGLIAKHYKAGGASAISVLTEPQFFKGSMTDVGLARQASGLPILRKDFIFDPYQVIEAKAYGADAILLIADVLAPNQLKELVQTAINIHLDVLVEVFTSAVLPAALNSGAKLIGINTRNLRTLKMVPDNVVSLSRLIPRDRSIVAESGIKTAEDMEKLKSLRVSAALIGESLLKKPDLESGVRELVTAGKRIS